MVQRWQGNGYQIGMEDEGGERERERGSSRLLDFLQWQCIANYSEGIPDMGIFNSL